MAVVVPVLGLPPLLVFTITGALLVTLLTLLAAIYLTYRLCKRRRKAPPSSGTERKHRKTRLPPGGPGSVSESGGGSRVLKFFRRDRGSLVSIHIESCSDSARKTSRRETAPNMLCLSQLQVPDKQDSEKLHRREVKQQRAIQNGDAPPCTMESMSKKVCEIEAKLAAAMSSPTSSIGSTSSITSVEIVEPHMKPPMLTRQSTNYFDVMSSRSAGESSQGTPSQASGGLHVVSSGNSLRKMGVQSLNGVQTLAV